MVSETRNKAKNEGKGLKLLTPKQLLHTIIKIDTIFMNAKNIESYALILKFTDKLDLRRCEKGIALSNLSIYYK